MQNEAGEFVDISRCQHRSHEWRIQDLQYFWANSVYGFLLRRGCCQRTFAITISRLGALANLVWDQVLLQFITVSLRILLDCLFLLVGFP
ncbi:hypothetical protein TcWFU_002464 [Taenia crassiceps]|uniref:DNA-directed DNA polymerase n=1 Tax=Taenia crassiceps TaxID=6207 RepID=A0ABR4Q5D9_9CEST